MYENSISIFLIALMKHLGKLTIVRRRTCVASIIKMGATRNFVKDNTCASSWASKIPLVRRRTLILFNELYSPGDGVPFMSWLSKSELWDIDRNENKESDNEKTAIVFIYRLTCSIRER